MSNDSNVYLELNVLASTVAMRLAPLGESLRSTQKFWRSRHLDVSMSLYSWLASPRTWGSGSSAAILCSKRLQTQSWKIIKISRVTAVSSSFFQFLHHHIFAVWVATWKCTPCIVYQFKIIKNLYACRNLSSWHVFVCRVCDLASAVSGGQPLGSQSRSTCCSA